MLDPVLLEILACPEDKSPLRYLPDAPALLCTSCHRRYPVREGIPVMLVEEAEQLSDAEAAAFLGDPPAAPGA